MRHLGHADVEALREYEDWHIAIRGGARHISIWASSTMVFLSLANVPVFYQPGPWEEYLERLFQRAGA